MEKLTLQNIIDAFVEQTGLSKKGADTIARTFFDVIVEGLNEDGQVKINGLGTFKVVEVAERESVNVNTGERIVIGGYKKVTFTPADSATNVSEVTATLTNKRKRRSKRIKDADEQPKPKKEKVVEIPAAEEEAQFAGIDSVIATPESFKAAKKKAQEATESVAEKVTSAAPAEKAVAPAEKPEAPKPEKPAGKGSKNRILPIVICVLALLCILLMVKFCNSPKEEPQPVVEEPEAVVEEPKDTVEQKIYVMQPGDFLARISRNEYGTTDSVDAIIRLNHITNPDSLEVGTTLLMP